MLSRPVSPEKLDGCRWNTHNSARPRLEQIALEPRERRTSNSMEKAGRAIETARNKAWNHVRAVYANYGHGAAGFRGHSDSDHTAAANSDTRCHVLKTIRG